MRLAAALAAICVTLASCTTVASATSESTHDERSASADPANAVPLSDTAAASEPAVFEELPASASLIVRAADGELTVHERPGGPVLTALPAVDDRGVTTTLGVLGRPDGDWAEVLIDQRPNFSTGWVHMPSVSVTWTTLRIEVNLSEHRLTLFDGDNVITFGTVAIGRSWTPTPIGTTYVAEILVNPDQENLYGPFAMGLALYSDELTEYAGGNGQIGIHGTNRPDLLGHDVSHGCVRTHNDLISELAGRVPLGTPVLITP